VRERFTDAPATLARAKTRTQPLTTVNDLHPCT